MDSSFKRWVIMSVITLRLRNLLSFSYESNSEFSANFMLGFLTFYRSTGRRKDMMASFICKITFWFVEILSAISRRVY